MTRLLLFSFVSVFVLVPTNAASHRYCLGCRDAQSTSECVTRRCSSGPECELSMTKDRNGKLHINGGCTTPNYCVDLAYRPGSHEPKSEGTTICNACCLDRNRCVPDQCQQHIKETPEVFRPDKGLQCEVCSGGTCGIYPGKDPVLQCPDHLPYCMNIVKNEADGNKRLTKLCASEADCDAFWYNKTRHQSECTNFDAANIYDSEFECSFCCLTSNCNKDVRPPTNTLYIGPED